MATIKQINEALKDNGLNAELVKCKDHFYFSPLSSESGDLWRNGQMVCTNRLNSLTIDQWVKEAVILKYSK